ncbi:uncharacterized protein A1O9_03630 [Exophiala aquamarina CBS 119918]|uniref:DUF7923 domain-containing protein n=1 Tax=Exophiala aquamarina CBS 119918 TaxID=1182545 RepID=A0A072PGD1_9EURO|nr:uncharacterized protein A1O9_03630 [Exophiala aquamarina CBS 119918]KEF58787.1 hypothetical protein A1O9_03630 [Exophiala aquamarina CBS 119918]
MDFESLADKFEALQDDLAYANELCEQANIQFEKYRTEIYHSKRNMALLQQQLAQQTATSNVLRAQAEKHLIDLRRERVLNAQLQARLATENNSLKAMTKQAATAEEQLAEAKFDLEYLKCTTYLGDPQLPPLALNSEAPLTPEPFVVVLVDGDAYTLFSHKGAGQTNPGGLAAMQIKFEVTKYIRDQKGTIPFASKVITRVFQNFKSIITSENSSLRQRKTAQQQRDLTTFATQFTEKLPLFDFFDAGRGKERVDDKIREHFHLFLSQPNCYAVFLAVCFDNGFARMLERYVDHPSIREKIILVSSGYKALEIGELPLNTVIWPGVFATARPSKQLAAILERKIRERRKQRSLSKLSLDRSRTTTRQHMISTPGPETLSDLLQPWNVRLALAGYFGMGTLWLHDPDETEENNKHRPCITVQANQELD